MKKIYCLLGSVLLSLSSGFAQENHLRNSKWFLYGNELQFQPYAFPQITGTPVYGSAIASVCDNVGNPLISVYKNSGEVVAKGQYLGPILSLRDDNLDSDNIIIVPKPKHPDRYYIISSSEGYGLLYTEVDLTNMTLLNQDSLFYDWYGNPTYGWGGSGVASIIHSNGIDYWITAYNNNRISSYHVTENGINTSPSSTLELPYSDANATLKIKITRQRYSGIKKIAIVNFHNGILLREINTDTGEITTFNDGMNTSLQQRELVKYYSEIHSVDAEFSDDGATLYCVDDINNYGSVYAIQDSSITPIAEYGGFVAAQRGPDGLVYFLEGYGNLAQEQPSQANPYYTGISLFQGAFNQWAFLPKLVSINECLAANANATLIIPTFDPISPLCYGSGQNPLQNVSTNGIIGYWSPDFNNQATTTYTFKPYASCIPSATMNIIVTSIIPTFNSIEPICSGSTINPLPTLSNNGITGTWLPAVNNTATTTYTFTPTAGQCAPVTTMTIVVNPKATPAFNAIEPICSGSALTLPTTSTNGIAGNWSPTVNNIVTTTYTFTPTAGLCANTTTMTVTVNQKTTPTFSSIEPICSGSALTLPTTSTNGIAGSWSPTVNNIATTNYTFTPTAGLCANTTTMTVTVKTTPVFNEIGMINNGTINYTLPTTSTNGIAGVWNPSVVSEGERVHTFTPNTGECPITKSFLLMKQTTIDAVDDDFSYSPIIEGSGYDPNGDYYSLSVFDNDSIIFENSVSAYNATASIVSVTPYLDPHYNYPFVMTADGKIKIHRGTPQGSYSVVYKITQNACPTKYDTATAIIYIQDPNAYSRKTDTPELSNNISVYPNPSKDIFNFDLTNVKGDYDTVTVYNMLGAKIYENSLRGNSFNLIDLSDLVTGCYIAKVSGKSGIASFQLIKQ